MKKTITQFNGDIVEFPPIPAALGMAVVLVLLLSALYAGVKFQLW